MGIASGGLRSATRRGIEFERSVRGLLQRHGWFVMRSPGSKGFVDLIAIRKGDPILWIQAKISGTISSTEWNAIIDLAERFGGWPVLAIRPSPKKVAFYRLDGWREFDQRGRPWTKFCPQTLDKLFEPP